MNLFHSNKYLPSYSIKGFSETPEGVNLLRAKLIPSCQYLQKTQWDKKWTISK